MMYSNSAFENKLVQSYVAKVSHSTLFFVILDHKSLIDIISHINPTLQALNLSHTQAHSHVGAGGVHHHRRASGVLRPSKCCCAGSAGSSHTPRKATAVSLSSISSSAVASIFDREKSLMAKLSTIFQVLF